MKPQKDLLNIRLLHLLKFHLPKSVQKFLVPYRYDSSPPIRKLITMENPCTGSVLKAEQAVEALARVGVSSSELNILNIIAGPGVSDAQASANIKAFNECNRQRTAGHPELPHITISDVL